MKKIYLQPKTEVVKVLSIQMMAASLPGGNSDELTPGDEGDVKGEAWDIWEEE